MDVIILVLATIVVLLCLLYKQLHLIHNNLQIVLNKKEENFNENKEIINEQTKKDDTNEKHNNRYNESLDYIDRLAEWVKANSNYGGVKCSSECAKLSSFSLSKSTYPSFENTGQNEENDTNLKNQYNLIFNGTMQSYYGALPCKEDVCDFSFIIHFKENVEKAFSRVCISQDGNDKYTITEYYEGKHSVSLELYEDISEFEKYKILLQSGKKLGADVSFAINTHKIKMNGNMIDKNFVADEGKILWFAIFVLDE